MLQADNQKNQEGTGFLFQSKDGSDSQCWRLLTSLLIIGMIAAGTVVLFRVYLGDLLLWFQRYSALF